MNRPLIYQVTMLIISLASANMARADIFAFYDESGAISLSNQPTDSRYTVILHSADSARTTSAMASITPGMQAGTKNSTQKISFGSVVNEAARANDIEAALLHAIITAESNYNSRAVSRKGAVGLMQLMPATAKQYGVTDIYDPAQNVGGGTRYLKYLLKIFNNDRQLTLAAYNAGENAVARFGNKIPPYRETREYVNKVMQLYNQYRSNDAMTEL